MRLYVNGTLAASLPAGYLQNVQRPLRIASGNTDGAAAYFLPGRVDEVAVYGTALSAARVSAHFTAASSGGGGNQPPKASRPPRPTSGTVPLAVNFTGSSSSDPDGTIASYAWDLDGDGAYDDSSAAKPELPVHGGRQLQRAPACYRQPGRTRRLRPGHDHRPARAGGGSTYSQRARRHPGRLLAPGRGERHHGGRLLGGKPHGQLPEHAHARSRRSAHRGLQHGRRLQRHRRVRAGPLRRCPEPGLLHGRGVGVRHRRPGHLPLARHEPPVRPRRRARLHPVRGRRQQMATVDRERQLERARRARRHPQSVDAHRRQLRRNHDAPVRERNPCCLLTGRLPAERPAPTADRERQHRRRRRLLPARTRGRGCGVRHCALGRTRVRALHGCEFGRWQQPAADCRRRARRPRAAPCPSR